MYLLGYIKSINNNIITLDNFSITPIVNRRIYFNGFNKVTRSTKIKEFNVQTFEITLESIPELFIGDEVLL